MVTVMVTVMSHRRVDIDKHFAKVQKEPVFLNVSSFIVSRMKKYYSTKK